MSAIISLILSYLLNALLMTLSQLFILFGIFIILAGIMNLIARQNEYLGIRIFGMKAYLYLFGWLGTAVHELGHAFFALLFGHRIVSIKLFTPNSKDGSLGHVSHSWNRNSLYQNIGNFFIGVGPLIIGSLCIYLVTLSLFGSKTMSVALDLNYQQLKDFDSFTIALKSIGIAFFDYMQNILHGSSFKWWKLCIFIYILYAVGSSVSLSSSDMKSTGYGLIFLSLSLLVFNLLTLWTGSFATDIILWLSAFLSPFYLLIILSIGVNIFFLFLLLILSLLPVERK